MAGMRDPGEQPSDERANAHRANPRHLSQRALLDLEERALHYLASPKTTEPPDDMYELSAVFDAVAANRKPGHVRAGYSVRGVPGSADVSMAPALTAALARGHTSLADMFVDLWGIDMSLWRLLDDRSAIERLATRYPTQCASIWLRSPARALLRDLDVVHTLAQSSRDDASRFTVARIEQAAGVDALPSQSEGLADWLQGTPPRWRELHTSVPGLLMTLWRPHDGRVATALRRLDSGTPYMVRAGALAWLLGRAATAPPYDIDGLVGDLRHDLPLRIAATLDDTASADDSFSVELETALLHHAAFIADSDGSRGRDPTATVRAWSIARWLFRCIQRSPFYSDDEQLTSARLIARLPEASLLDSTALDGLDPLHPWRLGRHGIGLDDLSLVAAAVAHYHGPGPHLDPVPPPLIRALRQLARRTLRPGECDAERAMNRAWPKRAADVSGARGLATPGNALGWPVPHVAPPWVARRFLTERRMHWLADAPTAVHDECLDTLTQAPTRYAWLAFAFSTEVDSLPDESARAVANVWVTLTDERLPVESSAALAIAGLAHLTDDERASALELACRADSDWPPYLLDAHASAAMRLALHEHMRNAIVALIDIAERDSDQVSPQDRVNSAYLAAQQLVRANEANTAEDHERLSALIRQPPFRDHAPLQRAIRRMGLNRQPLWP